MDTKETIECPICYETLKNDAKRFTECMHCFCILCFTKIHETNIQCLLCRTPLIESKEQEEEKEEEYDSEEEEECLEIIITRQRSRSFIFSYHAPRSISAVISRNNN